jgi:hypothetical protein
MLNPLLSTLRRTSDRFTDGFAVTTRMIAIQYLLCVLANTERDTARKIIFYNVFCCSLYISI